MKAGLRHKVMEAGGGTILLYVDRDLDYYPEVGEMFMLVSPPTMPPEYVDVQPLTQRQTQLLQYLVNGKASRKELARAMGLTQATIANHFEAIFKRLNVADKTQAVVKALRLGMVHL